MEFFKWLIYGLCIKVLKENLPKILSYIKQMVREPLFWGIVIGVLIFIIIGIVGYGLERREKRNLDKKNICQYCKGYGELVTKTKGEKKNTICPHCCGTGWTVEG